MCIIENVSKRRNKQKQENIKESYENYNVDGFCFDIMLWLVLCVYYLCIKRVNIQRNRPRSRNNPKKITSKNKYE